jgi:hypothetical protein
MQANPFTVKVEEDVVPSQPFMTVGCTACSSVSFAVVFAVVPLVVVKLSVGAFVGQERISS